MKRLTVYRYQQFLRGERYLRECKFPGSLTYVFKKNSETLIVGYAIGYLESNVHSKCFIIPKNYIPRFSSTFIKVRPGVLLTASIKPNKQHNPISWKFIDLTNIFNGE